MPPFDDYEKQAAIVRSQFIALKKALASYQGSLPLVNVKKIDKEKFNSIINILGDITDDTKVTAEQLAENLSFIDIYLSNDINHYSNDYAKGKLKGTDKELYELMRKVRNEVRSTYGITNKYKDAYTTIDTFYKDYQIGKFDRDAASIYQLIGNTGTKPSIGSLESLSIEGKAPESIMPQLIWIAQHDAMSLHQNTNVDANQKQTIYKQTFNRLLREIKTAPPDVQAEYAVYLAKYEYALRTEAKKHYDEYLKNAPKNVDSKAYAKEQLANDPIFWSCTNTHTFVNCFNSSNMGEVYFALASWESKGYSPMNSASFSMLGEMILNAKASEAEIEFAMQETEKSGYAVTSTAGEIAYAYGVFLKDNGKNGTLFNSMKYNFNDFAKLNHDDIGELSRKNYYGKLGRAENAVNRYIASFEGKTPKGKDLENINFAKSLKETLANQRAIISKTAPLPNEVYTEKLPTEAESFKSINDLYAEADAVDPKLLISSKEFKAIKNTLKEFNALTKTINPKTPHTLDRMEALKECCQLLNLQSEAYIELKEDPFRSPKQAHLKEGSTAKSRYDFVKKVQSTMKEILKSITVEEKKVHEAFSAGKALENGDNPPITLSEYNESIKPLLSEQVQDLKDIYTHRGDNSDARTKNEDMLRNKYGLAKDTPMCNVYTVIDLRKDGLMYAMNDIQCAINASGNNNPEANLSILIEKPSILALPKLITAEILERKLLDNPNALDSMNKDKYDNLLESVNSFVRETYQDESGAMKPMSADTLLKDFCTSAGIRERVATFENYCKENKIADPLKQNPEQQAMHI